LDDGILLQQNWGRFERVMQAKVAGSWHLHTLTADYKLDFFVLFSSTVGLFGNAGQGNHAAANAFLDSLAYYRQGLGLPALCIDWGAWGEVGAAARRQVLTTGATLITPSHGLRMLEAAMLQAGAQLAAVPLVRHELPNRPLFAELQPLEADAPASVTTGDSFMTQLLALPVGKRHTWLKEEVQTQLTAVLGVFGSDWWGTDAGFFDMGMDSLTAVEFRNALQNRVQIPLPTTVAFDYPTIATLADYLLEAIEIVEKGDSEIKTVQVEKAQKATNQEASEANRDAVMLDLLDEDALALLLDEELEGFEE
jgi:acyl carrier protein